MSGLLDYFQSSASSFLGTARNFADRTLGAIFNLASLPKPRSNLTPIPGFIESSHEKFIEALKRDFLKNGNSPAALYSFLKAFETGNPKVELHLNQLVYSQSKAKKQATPIQLFFCCLLASVELSNRPFYRVREAINYIIAQYPAGFSPYALELLSLVDHYEKSLEETPDFLLAKLLKPGSNILEEVDADDGQPLTLSLSYFPSLALMEPFESTSVETLDAELEAYFESHFPELKTLFSDAYQYFINKHLACMPSDDHLKFYQILLDYVTRVSKNIQDNIFYGDKISEVYLDKRDRLFELNGFLETQIKMLQEAQKKVDSETEKKHESDVKPEAKVKQTAESLNRHSHQLTKVSKAVFQATQRFGSHIKSHPLQSLVGFLAVFGQRVLAEPHNENSLIHGRILATSIRYPEMQYNATVGRLFFQDMGAIYAACGSRPSPTVFMVCPYTAMGLDTYTNTPGHFDSPKWLSITTASGNISLSGTPKIGDVRFWSETNLGVSLYNCPSPWSGDLNACSLQSFLNTRVKIFTKDTPPYPIALANDTQPDPTLEPGVQPIIGEGSSFSGNFLTNGAGDLENDTVLFQASLANGNRLPVWMTAIPSSGDISVVPPPGNAGKWNIQMRLYNPDWDGKTVVDYSFNTVTWSSFRLISSYIRIPAEPIQLNIPIDDQVYLATSDQKLVISAATSAIVIVPSATPVSITLRAAGNGTLPANMVYKPSRQAVEFSPNPQQVSFGTYDCELLACDTPSYACASNTACEPVTASCVTVPFSAEYRNSRPGLPELTPTSTTIGTAITLTNIAARSTDADLDDLTFSIRIKPDTGHVMPDGVLIDSRTGEVSWLPTKGSAPGTYQFEILADDGHGGLGSTTWTVTLTPRPIQIKSGLQSTVASTPMQRAGSATYPFPFRAPDLTDAQLPAFASQVDVQIPEALAPFVSVQLNTSTLSYHVSWTSIPGHGGSSPIIFTYTDPLTGQQTSTQTFLEVTNAGPYKISNPAFVTDLTGMPADYDLATHFGHLDPDTALHFSADLPAGLELSDEGRISGTPEIPGPYKIAVSVTDDYGRTLSSASLDLTVPYAPPTVLSSHRDAISVAIDPTSFTPELTGTFQTPSPDGLPQTYKLLSGPDCLTLASDGSWAVNLQNGQQGKNYTAVIQVSNGDQTDTFTKIISVPRGVLQLQHIPNDLRAYIAQSLGFDVCHFVQDPDSPGSCSNLVLTWDIPPELSATNQTAQAISTIGSTATLNAPLGSRLQGLHTVGFTWTDSLSSRRLPGSLQIQILNRAPTVTNGVDLTTATPEDAESTFTLSYMTAGDPDGDPVSTAVTAIPKGCVDTPLQKIISCARVPAGLYNIRFNFTDSFGAFTNSTLILSVAAVVSTSIYLSLFIKIAPAVLGAVLSASAPLIWSYIKDALREKATNKQFAVLTPLIKLGTSRAAQIAREKKVLPSQLRLPKPAHPLLINPEAAASHDSPRLLVGAGAGTGAGAGCSDTASEAGMTPRLGAHEVSSTSTRASALSVKLKNQVESVTGDPHTIEKFQALFTQYIAQVDAYHLEGGANIASNCNLLLTAESLASRLNWLLTNAESYKTDKAGKTEATSSLIDPHIIMMVYWLKALYTRFVSYHSGLANRQAIRLKDKRSLLQNLSELVKTARQSLAIATDVNFGEGLALYKELEDLRGAITSVRDEVVPSLKKSLMSPFRHSVDYGPASLPFKALYPKTWFPYTFAIQALSPMAVLNLVSLQLLNQLIAQANGENEKAKVKTKLEFNGQAIPLEKLKKPKDRGVVNYFAADSYLGILEYWIGHHDKIKPTDPRVPHESKYFEYLFQAIAKSLSRTLYDQIGEARIRVFVQNKIKIAMVNLLIRMPNKIMAAHLLLGLSRYFNQAIVREIVTNYVAEPPLIPASGAATQNHRAIFYTELATQFRSPATTHPKKPQELKLWLENTPDDTIGIEDCRRELMPKHGSHQSLVARVSTAFSPSLSSANFSVPNPLGTPTGLKNLGQSRRSRIAGLGVVTPVLPPPPPPGFVVDGRAVPVLQMTRTKSSRPKGSGVFHTPGVMPGATAPHQDAKDAAGEVLKAEAPV